MRDRRRRFEEQVTAAVHEDAPPLPTNAVLALQRAAGNQATCRALQRVLTTKGAFAAMPVVTTTIGTLLRSDPDLQAIADQLSRYANPGTTAPLTIAQAVSAACKQWLAANPPPGWQQGAIRPAWGASPSATNPQVINAVRQVVSRLHDDVQQELVQLAGAQANGQTQTVFSEQTRPSGQGQTPDQATLPGIVSVDDDTPRQRHWEGWKIHVSVPASVAGDVASAIVPQLEQDGGWYKVRKRIDEYRRVTDESVGKFIVIYPDSIDHLEQLLTRLESTLPGLVGGRPAPAINGDVQLDAGGYVWARYGVFLDRTGRYGRVPLGTGQDERSQYAVQDPVGGGWVKDPRDQPIPAAWANQLLGQIQAIRQHRHTQALRDAEQTAHQERNRPRASSV